MKRSDLGRRRRGRRPYGWSYRDPLGLAGSPCFDARRAYSEIGHAPSNVRDLVTPKALHEVGLFDSVLEEVDGARIHGPSQVLSCRSERMVNSRTYVVCRKKVRPRCRSAGNGGWSFTLWLNSQPIVPQMSLQDERVYPSESIQNGEVITTSIANC